MNPIHHIRYVRRQEIDVLKWDRCIDEAPNGLIYAYSYYLDHMALHWDALILNDYEAIMPLTWNKKWGIRYLFQPPFTQQLGVFSIHTLPEEHIRQFLSEVKKYFNFAEIFLNYGNNHSALKTHTNYILDLHAPYEELRTKYNKDIEKNLKKAAKSQFRFTDAIDYSQAIRLYQSEYGRRFSNVRQSDYDHFEKLCSQIQYSADLKTQSSADLKTQNKSDFNTRSSSGIIVRAVYAGSNELMAVALLAVSNIPGKQRMHLLMSTTLPAGKKTAANHFLLDSLIREFAGQDLILDFEGSDIPGIASFYQNFGSIDQPYHFFRYNHLPWPLKWLK
jgi:hypothetical protein